MREGSESLWQQTTCGAQHVRRRARDQGKQTMRGSPFGEGALWSHGT
jgi:hypothetical protein